MEPERSSLNSWTTPIQSTPQIPHEVTWHWALGRLILLKRAASKIAVIFHALPQPHSIGLSIVGLERCPLSLVSTTGELLERKNSGSGLEGEDYGRRDPSHWPRDTLCPQKLALTSPTSGDRSVGIVRSLTKAMELLLLLLLFTTLFWT
jgi:hypothetical protein